MLSATQAGTPAEGQPVSALATTRSVIAALDLLGRRWVLRILWELRDGPVGFRALQDRCGNMSSSVLSARLADLSSNGIIATDQLGRYGHTAVGESLMAALQPLWDWSIEWAYGRVPNEGRPSSSGSTR